MPPGNGSPWNHGAGNFGGQANVRLQEAFVVNTCCTGTTADLAEALGYSSSALRLRRYLAIQAQSAVGAFVTPAFALGGVACNSLPKGPTEQGRRGTIC
jgi:hypothetical protein